MRSRRNSTPIKPRELGASGPSRLAHIQGLHVIPGGGEILRLPGFSPHLASWLAIHFAPSTGRQRHPDYRAYKRSQRREHRLLPKSGNILPGRDSASAPAPTARPAPVPIASPMSVFRPRCPGRFRATRRMSCRESVSWLVVALIASDSGVTRCMNPRRVFPFASVTRISAPVTSWLRLAQFAIGLACWAAAVAARVAANRAGKKMRLGILFIKRTFTPRTRYPANHTRTRSDYRPSKSTSPLITATR
jgi:hypothetical protein